ncbi:universal stress protein [Streptomyces althioticus]|uniref:universal stress protein n=1 Tax=Streptomyces althioticus TaxID=83380 RepID=UPI0036A430BD
MADNIVAAGVERARLRRRDLEVSGGIVSEDAVSAFLHAAHDASTLVTGSRGRGGVAGMLLGSVSLTVAARAVCPVIVVRGGTRNRQGGVRPCHGGRRRPHAELGRRTLRLP